MNELMGGGDSYAWYSILLSVALAMFAVIVLTMTLATVLSEDERYFWSEWYPFIDKKRRRIVLESNATGWVVLKELPGETKNELRRIFYAPCSPLKYVGWKKTVVIPTGNSQPFPCDVELWNSHFGGQKNPERVSVFV